MIRSSRRLAVALAICAAAVLPAALASACVAVVSLTNRSAAVQPGGTVSVTGREFAMNVPIDIHLDSPTGPVLVTVPPLMSTMNSSFTVDVPIPASITPGEHFFVATQNHHDMNTGQPARSRFFVGTAPPTTAGPARPVALEEASGPSAASLILIGLGAMVVALLVVGLWGMASARRSGGGGDTSGAEAVTA
jgi:hypothetical protein